MQELNLASYSTVKSILTRHGFSFSKSLGQNFIVDPSVCPEMAASCLKPGMGALEIGPGCGVLTKELALRAEKVVSVEVDASLLPVLSETLNGFENVKVINSDVLKLDLNELIAKEFSGMDVAVCANLPYYITSPVIMKLLESRLNVKSITVMVQKEVADRLCAKVGSRDAGVITAAVNYFAYAERLFDIGKECFFPQPKVESAIIRLTLRNEPPVEVSDEKFFFMVVKAAFAMRRKTLLNSVSSSLSLPKEKVSTAIERSSLAQTVRGEALTMEQLAAFSKALRELT